MHKDFFCWVYNDVDDIGEGDGDLEDSFVVVRGASKKEI